MIYSILKTTLKKEEPKLYKYRYSKKCDRTAFHRDLQSKLEEGPNVYQKFKETFVRVLDAHGRRKTKVFYGSHKPHVDKTLRKGIMKRRTKQQEDITKYKKQQNLVVKLNKETKLQYFNNLETLKISKHF